MRMRLRTRYPPPWNVMIAWNPWMRSIILNLYQYLCIVSTTIHKLVTKGKYIFNVEKEKKKRGWKCKFLFDMSVPVQHTEVRCYFTYKYEREIINQYPEFTEFTEFMVCPSTGRCVTIVKPTETDDMRITSFTNFLIFECCLERPPLIIIFELYVCRKFSGRDFVEVSICSWPVKPGRKSTWVKSTTPSYVFCTFWLIFRKKA